MLFFELDRENAIFWSGAKKCSIFFALFKKKPSFLLICIKKLLLLVQIENVLLVFDPDQKNVFFLTGSKIWQWIVPIAGGYSAFINRNLVAHTLTSLHTLRQGRLPIRKTIKNYSRKIRLVEDVGYNCLK